ncbi:hypothetical protein C8R43DRAFT_1158791 [Mycena crocata]|nr:hypothetical protein C8R43DRAFT_1158791 [Mycena crocata]
MSLSEDGVLGKWTRLQHQWQWGRILNVGSEKRAPEDTVCLAYARDRIAVAFPQSGVKVWMWTKGTWLAQRSIMRTNVTALKFINGGDALLGGTREGVVWHCAVPNGTMKVYAFMQSSITSIEINLTGTHALIAQTGGSACFVSLGLQDDKRVGQAFLDPCITDAKAGAIYTSQGNTVVFGLVDGCLLAWDAQKGGIMYGMEPEDGEIPTACFADVRVDEGCMVVTGTTRGQLAWWPQPTGLAQGPQSVSRKRAKVK